MVKVNLQPAQFTGTTGAVATWRMECLAMEALHIDAGIKLQAYMWSVLPGLEPNNTKNWRWHPVDIEDMDELEEACENYQNTEEDQPNEAECSTERQNMYRLLDLVAAGKKFLESACKFHGGMADSQ